jgi:carbamoylphosphate synthase large subunit
MLIHSNHRTRISLSNSFHSAARPRPQRLILFGKVLRRWQPILSAERLAALPGIDEFRRVKRLLQIWAMPQAERRQSLVLCVSERSMLMCPRDGWTLMPSRRALYALGDKLRFARYAAEQRLGDYVPRTYENRASAPFPAVLKLRRGFAGSGVAVVQSTAELALARRRMRKSWGQPALLQELIAGDDHVTHAICRDGRLLWHCTYDHQLEAGELVQTHVNVARRQRGALTPDDVAVLERFLVPLKFDGPIAVDFKRRADGRLCVIEINPRFGGSLMLPENSADLDAALAVLVASAKPGGRQ